MSGKKVFMARRQIERGKQVRKGKAIIIAAIVMFILIGGICIMSVRSASAYGYARGPIIFSLGGRAELRNTIEIPLNEAKNLKLVYGSKNIKIYPAQDDRITIREYLYSDKPEAHAEVVYGVGGEITVTGTRNFVIFGFGIGEGERIEVYLPERGLEGFSVETGSGNIISEAGYYQENGVLAVRAGSGNINWKQGADAGEISFKAGSGNVKVENLKGSMELGAGSGNVSAQKLEGEVRAKTGSGGITLEEFSGSGSMEAGSGNIKVEAMQVSGNLELQTNSGNIKLTLGGKPNCRLKINTGSGSIRTDFDEQLSFNKKGNSAEGLVGDEPFADISVKAGSGNVHIVNK